jgi:hypothetical protein
MEKFDLDVEELARAREEIRGCSAELQRLVQERLPAYWEPGPEEAAAAAEDEPAEQS